MAKPKHLYDVIIRTTPERLWQAITDPADTARYFHGSRIASTFAPGAPVHYTMPDGSVGVVGEVLEADPPSRLVFTWSFQYHPTLAAEPASRVTWTIVASGDVCKLTLVHDEFHGANRTSEYVERGWFEVLDGLKTLLETGQPLPPFVDDEQREIDSIEPVDIDALAERRAGIDAHQRTWELLEMAERTPDQEAEMVEAAHASSYHWRRASGRTAANDARGEWLVSRVYAVLGRAEPALHHARRCAAVVAAEPTAMADFDHAYAHEGLARALACAGDLDAAAAELAQARAVTIAGDEDRSIVEGDLAAEPWFGLKTAAG